LKTNKFKTLLRLNINSSFLINIHFKGYQLQTKLLIQPRKRLISVRGKSVKIKLIAPSPENPQNPFGFPHNVFL